MKARRGVRTQIAQNLRGDRRTEQSSTEFEGESQQNLQASHTCLGNRVVPIEIGRRRDDPVDIDDAAETREGVAQIVIGGMQQQVLDAGNAHGNAARGGHTYGTPPKGVRVQPEEFSRRAEIPVNLRPHAACLAK